MREVVLSIIFAYIVVATIPLSTAFSTITRQLHGHILPTAINALHSTEYDTACDAFIKEQIEKKDVDSVLPTNQDLHHPRSKMRDTRPFPFGLIVDQQTIKHALLLSATNPKSIGVLIGGGHGTGKSILARSMSRIVPTHIKIVKGSEYNIHPDLDDGVDSVLLQRLQNGEQITETEFIPTPMVHIPLGVMEDSLVGAVDLEGSLETGTPIFSPGLLAKAHRGILYIDDINLLDDEVVDILIKVMSDGCVIVEREGLSLRYPCRPLIIASYNPEEGELREHLHDRFAITLSADVTRLTTEERVVAVDHVIGFEGGTQQNSARAEDDLRKVEVEEQTLRTRVEMARMRLHQVEITTSQIKYLCEEATRAGCEGQRAEIFATEISKASAALDGRTSVSKEDLQKAVVLAILPRATVFPGDLVESGDGDMTKASPSPPPPPPLPSPQEMSPILEQPPMADDSYDHDTVDTENETEDETQLEPDDSEQEEDHNEPDEPITIPEEFFFDAAKDVHLDPSLLKISRWTRVGRGGKRAKLFNLLRGRFVKAIFPKGKKGRLAVAATLRAAAPYQKSRRKRAIGTRKEGRLVHVIKDDFRIKRMSRKAGTLVIFCVDSSGSMALNRMNAAKGAAIQLLSDAYKSRDKIALITFHGDSAQVLVPPTKSMALTKNRLESMPCGGGSPLAHSLMLAAHTALNTMKVKQDVGRVVIVLITDGRANIPLELSMDHTFTPSTDPESKDGMPSRNFLKDEVLACAKKLASVKDIDVVVIDTEDAFIRTGVAKDIATAALGKYVHLDKTDSMSVAQITRQNIRNEMKK
jgi:magnesium chelatase subunit D